jgi:hypothetical protein
LNPPAESSHTANDAQVHRCRAPRSPEPARFRLVHHAEVINLKGDSYRLKNRDLGRIPTQATEE